jgi:membrane associated rhomboid family serine protease
MESAPVTFLIILATGVISWLGFRDRYLVEKYIFRPEDILARKQYYRLITSGFLHGDWQHLLFNMISLFFFGPLIEARAGVLNFLLIYLGSIVGGNLLSLWIHRHHDYSAYGASGGVIGIIYASIFLYPGGSIMIFPVPIPIPAWVYAIIYLVLSFYGMKARRDNIGHDAHLGGAICGLLITTGLYPGIVPASPLLFAAVLGLSILLLIYILANPLFLPPSAFWRSFKSRRSGFRQHRRR